MKCFIRLFCPDAQTVRMDWIKLYYIAYRYFKSQFYDLAFFSQGYFYFPCFLKKLPQLAC